MAMAASRASSRLECRTTSAPASASARDIAAPRPREAPVTRATRSFRLKRSAIATSAGAALFETGTPGREIRVNVHDAELTILQFTARRHHPEEVDRMAGRGDVRMVALRHEDDISLTNDRRKLRILVVRVDQLDAEGRVRHVDVKVRL